MKVLYISQAPQEVQKAFGHVRALFPDVSQVLYDQDCRWCYEGENNYFPDFDTKEVDTNILESGADSQYNIEVPVLYKMFKEVLVAKCEVPDKPTVTLTQIDHDLWEVNVGVAAHTWETLESGLAEFKDSINEYQLKIPRSM
ncbi:hypothetical protein pEaSNUABM50_00023 [Erwinia phage pEa_SNUABM_50]|uniref:Uncharacterized protein n=4 Tax=Eneladusvirus BF TaxID=2560751 RepID=A0A7L8ZMM0_9CAUD|nr:hypothetical protein FDH34_gp024 [Serratia phage BF]QOI70962.1 hypothetical protein pEaSNUABM12_00024 [Erwinia phage pEa_SNUABM_12]QOI71507.1 hypothetical protein pEaSNUABM47_00023 [Erwinia phage pEa_SNUABM_47]QOI72047.1 hypothetical protein pEaSNUABM50_00023 [Erwinia phage pEa_SNUABM_50]QXO11170.1 hypothetical protein pEaSNUABM19_00024 [Erwinia phage pEa_SNUABM_19]QXO11718.1 hypothetical protein pEaSNUABM44_00022 [Erwinia phage pEa_SNUABM_44]QXO12269.1 hypothetical protein pEaSNUABM49_000